jgi:hypothetical protein
VEGESGNDYNEEVKLIRLWRIEVMVGPVGRVGMVKGVILNQRMKGGEKRAPLALIRLRNCSR